MIVTSFKVALILGVAFISDVTGASFSNVYMEREFPPVQYYKYGAPYSAVTSPRLTQIESMPVSPTYVTPCALPCVYPNKPMATIASVTPVNSNANALPYKATISSVPVVVTPDKEESNRYEYSYVVYDESTGDHKAQRELSDGSIVRGEYAFLQPDGYVREVQYIADDMTGFNAIVKNFLPVAAEDKRTDPDCHKDKKESLIDGLDGEFESRSEKQRHPLKKIKNLSENGSEEELSKESIENIKNNAKKTFTKSKNESIHYNKSEERSNEEEFSEEEDTQGNYQLKKGSIEETEETEEESQEESEQDSKENHHKKLKKGFRAVSKKEFEDKQNTDRSRERSSADSEETNPKKVNIVYIIKSEEKFGEEKSKETHQKINHKEKSEEESKESVKLGDNNHTSKKGTKNESNEESDKQTHEKYSKKSHQKAPKESNESGKESKSEQPGERGLITISYETARKQTKESEESTEELNKEPKSVHKGEPSEKSKEDSHEFITHAEHKMPHESTETKHEVLIPYNDIIKCVQEALRRANMEPSLMREKPSPLIYLILNKPMC